ncbi:GAF and ANTAR domain-containing protein [Streptomyces sp. TG1A-8]|uniref:GAF and ANTAR domain-containing protein n=1 Tax=Streptomyces sp. TG1A-8 TaxID=3051385 RepID=UPI00265B82C4|nr:GAF and ANTAR domain-containing protein [Streptomyces sp. TG1A-8]MDO0926967.1 GAF and ANTAR domain-containing protein [Streptomyces sp. TG1A-8]
MTRFPVGLELAEALTVAARQLHETTTPHATLRTAVRLAVHLLPGAEHAGISEIERGEARRTVAWTDDIVRDAEAPDLPHWQRLWTSSVVRTADGGDAAEEGPLSDLGLRSVLSMRLRADKRRLTVLTAYSRDPHAFDETATRLGRLFTTHVSLALNSVTVREQLTEAMRTRDLIGQATGILMERLDIDASAAFESLVRASQRENVKLRDLARRIVGTAENPSSAPAGGRGPSGGGQ